MTHCPFKKIRDENPWVTVEPNGAVRVKKKWDFEELGREKTIDFWVIITNSGSGGRTVGRRLLYRKKKFRENIHFGQNDLGFCLTDERLVKCFKNKISHFFTRRIPQTWFRTLLGSTYCSAVSVKICHIFQLTIFISCRV
jgi:hypothetical protein